MRNLPLFTIRWRLCRRCRSLHPIHSSRALHLPGRRGPEQTRQLLLPMAHPVAQVRAERDAISEIVIPLHLLAPPAALGLAFHQHQFQRLALAGGACDRRRFRANSGYIRPSRPSAAQRSAVREASEGLRPGAAPAVAGTRDSSTLHWAVSTPATHRRCARSRSLRDRKSPAQSGASGPVRWGRTCVRKRSGIRACHWVARL